MSMFPPRPVPDEENLRINRRLKVTDDTHNSGVKPIPLRCINDQCMVSTTSDGIITFGTGELSPYGHFDYPCEACARAYEAKNPGTKCWPPVYEPAIKHRDDPNNLKIGGFDVPIDAFMKVHGPDLLWKLQKVSDKLNYRDPTKWGEKREGLYCAECKQFTKWGEINYFSIGGKGRFLNIDMCDTCIKKYKNCEYDIPEGYYRVY